MSKGPYDIKGFDMVTEDIEVHVTMKPTTDRLNTAYRNLRTNIMNGMVAHMPVREGMLRDLTTAANVIMEGTEEMFAAIGSYGRFLYYGKVMIGEKSRSPWARKNEKKVVTNKPLDLVHSSNPNAVPFWFDEAKKKGKEKGK